MHTTTLLSSSCPRPARQIFLVLYLAGCWGDSLTRGSTAQALLPSLAALDIRGVFSPSATLFAHACLARVAQRHAFGLQDRGAAGGDNSISTSLPIEDLALVCRGDDSMTESRVLTALRTEIHPRLPAVQATRGVLIVPSDVLTKWCRRERARVGLPPSAALASARAAASAPAFALLSPL